MHKYELGGYFHGHPKAFQEGAPYCIYMQWIPALVISLPGLTSEEAKHIQKDRLTLVYLKRKVSFFY